MVGRNKRRDVGSDHIRIQKGPPSTPVRVQALPANGKRRNANALFCQVQAQRFKIAMSPA
jgi:hypothetical protein